MKIKNKLTLQFTLLVACILVSLNLYIYLLSRASITTGFYNQLKDRAITAATVFLEADEASSATIKAFQKKYLHTLPGEIIRVYDENNVRAFADSSNPYIFDVPFINSIREKNEYREEHGDRQSVGIYYQDNQGNFVIIASAIDEAGIRALSQLKNVLLLGFLLSIVVVFIAGRYFTNVMLKPVSSISSQASRISETNLHLRLNEGNKKDELAVLSVTINRMLERLESAFDLQKDFVANASHELRTPLTSIIGNIEVTLTKNREQEEYREVLESVMLEAEKLQKLTNGLLNLAQSNLDFSGLRKEDIRMDELLIEMKDELLVKRPGSKVELVFPSMPENPSLLTVAGDKNLMETAVLNLMDNACKFSDGKPVKASLYADRGKIEIRITDQGIGINRVELPHVTETFFRAGNARQYVGSGIGLSLAEKIIALHRGTFAISSELNVGTEVTISFPVTTG